MLAGALQRVAQDRARAERPLLALDRDVAGEARDVRLPREDRQRRRVGHRDHVGVVRALADVAGREPGEPGAVGQQVVEVVRGDELGARLAVHVDELGEQKLDAVVLDDPPDIVGVLRGVCHGRRYIRARRSSGNGSGHRVSGG